MSSKRNRNIVDITDNCSPEQKYIILQNETLFKENKDFLKLVTELKLKISDYEDQIDTSDNSKRYIKGLLKNLVELEKMRKEISDINKVTLAKNIVFIEKCKTDMNKCFTYQLTFVILMMFLSFQFGLISLFEFLFIVFSSVVSEINFFYRSSKVFKIPENIEANERIQLIEASIKEIERGQDFLSEHIDSL
jgi:hypothetical protein